MVEVLITVLAFVTVVAWAVQLTQAHERRRQEDLDRRLTDANEAIRDLLRHNARMALLYVDLNAKFVTAMAREAGEADERDDDDLPQGRLVS
jgi:hypothetical protein